MRDVPVRVVAPGVSGQDGDTPEQSRRRRNPARSTPIAAPPAAARVAGKARSTPARAAGSASRREAKSKAPGPQSAVIRMRCPHCSTMLEHELLAAGELRLAKGE